MLKKKMSSFRLAALGLAVSGSLMMAQHAAAEVAIDESMMDSHDMSEVEVAASVAISSMYLWRGNNLGNTTPAISGDITASMAGSYGGLWTSSGDKESGNELDIYAGYGGEIEGFMYDLMLVTYVYSSNQVQDDTFGDLSEIILTLGYGPVHFSYYDNISGATGYEYYTLNASADAFSATLGYSDSEATGTDYTHLDLAYSYNDNLSFTLSQIVDAPDEANCAPGFSVYSGCDDDLKMAVSYSLPIDLK
tara:strand:+ start:47977 stop:48723 length:747 start_codon:yes stop_codon:yes gene_type:complete